MTESADIGRKTPGFAKGIMLFQTLIILILSSWIYEEYLNNIYLQDYVNNTVAADGALIALIVIVGALAISLGLFKILRSTHKQLGALSVQSEPVTLSSGTTFSSSSPTSTQSAPKSSSSVDLHPMVAALKADLAHQGSMEPIPPLDVKQATPPPAIEQAPPQAPQPRPMMGTPSTVITGTMPVLKRVDDKKQNSSQ